VFHIGVLTPRLQSAAEMLRRVDEASAARAGTHTELSLVWQPVAGRRDAWQRNDPDTVRTQLALGSARLREAGAHFFVCPDDTAYAPLDGPGADLALPGLHVAPVAAAEAQRQGFAKVGILGTRWTLGWRRYADELEPMGITAVPLPLWDQTTLHSIVFDELAHGRYSLRSRDVVLELVDDLRKQQCEAVVLACTELASLVTPASSPLPLLDTTQLLAHAAVAVAVGEAPLPRWRGGPRPVDVPDGGSLAGTPIGTRIGITA
jgi:aspartate racemase